MAWNQPEEMRDGTITVQLPIKGLGNNVTAMEHAKQAVSMEPDNYEYQMLLQQLQGNGSWYQQRQSTYQNPYSTGGDWCMKMCMLNLMCNCCLGGRYWC